MVFQDPMTALNPVLSVERQIVETLPPAGRSPPRPSGRISATSASRPERRLAATPTSSGGQRR